MRGIASPMIAGSSMRRSSACGTRKRCKWPLLAALAARIAAARCRMLTSASGGRPGRGAPSPGGIGDALGYPFHISCRACYRIRNIGNGVCGCEWTGESKGWWVAWGAGQKDSGLSKQTGLNKFNDLRRAIQRMVLAMCGRSIKDMGAGHTRLYDYLILSSSVNGTMHETITSTSSRSNKSNSFTTLNTQNLNPEP